MGSFSIRAIVIGVITFLCLSEVAHYSTFLLTTDIDKESEPNAVTTFLAVFLGDFLVMAIAAFVAAYAAKRLYIEHALAIAVAAILLRIVLVDTTAFGLISILSLLLKLAAAYVGGFLCMRWISSSVTPEETSAIVKEVEVSGNVANEEVSVDKYSQANTWYAWQCALIGILSKISFTVYWSFTTRANISGSEFYMFAVIILVTESTLSYYDGKIKLIGPTLLGLLAAEFIVMIFTMVAPDVSPVSYQIASPVLTTLVYIAMLAPVSVVGGIVGKLIGRFYGNKEIQDNNEQLVPWPFAIGFFLAVATPASHPLEKIIKDHIARDNVIEIARAEFEYFGEHPKEGFSCDLAKLAGRDAKQKNDTFGASYFINYHRGYRYELWCEPEAMPNNVFFIIAIPYSPSTSSDAVYCADESGAVRMASASQSYSTYRCRSSKTIIDMVADKGVATGARQQHPENDADSNRYPRIKESEIPYSILASKRGVNYERFKEINGTLRVHGTGDQRLPYGFNYDTTYVISINTAIPYINVHRENLAKSLIGEFGTQIIDKILFQNFGNHRPKSLSIIVGTAVPVKVLQAVLGVFSKTDIPITITMHADAEKHRYKAQSVVVGGLLEVQKDPVSREAIDILLREGITQEEFLNVVTKLQ